VSDRTTFVIVGGGLAGAKAAETLREEGFDGGIVLVADEPHLPYERPPLSKAYLAGQSTIADAQVHDDAFYSDHGVELLTSTRATAIDGHARRVSLSDGEELAYDRLLIATGAVPKRPAIPGADRDGVHVLRTVSDADALREVIVRRGRLAIIGAGWIGSEVAATARGTGVDVTLIEHADTPLQQVLGRKLGEFFADLHRGHGVDLRTGGGVARIEEGLRVVLEDETSIEADAVVLGVGVAPAAALAEAGGLRVDNGIVTDGRLRTSVDGVFAAGDVANVFNSRYGRHVRVEHWAAAADHGAAAARSMLDRGDPYTSVPFFFSDQYDLGMEYYGLHSPEDALVIRGDLAGACFQAYWIGADRCITAGMHANDWDAGDAIRRLVEEGASLEAVGVESGEPQRA
jgi:3-phenylpropionate/trans-cinnamate dioxygenase ferredoxin reductase component